MPPTAIVDEPRIDDAAAIARVHGRAWQSGYVGLLSAEYLASLDTNLEERTAFWRGRLERSTAGLLVARIVEGARETAGIRDQRDHRSTGELVGICTFDEPRDAAPTDTGELQMLNVDPTVWGAGVADALLEAAVQRLTERYAAAYLWVLDGNERAQRFYRRHGWRPDGVTRTEQVGGAPVNQLRYTVRFRDVASAAADASVDSASATPVEDDPE